MTPPSHLLDLQYALFLPNSTFNKCITQCDRCDISIVAIGERALGVRSGEGARDGIPLPH